MQNTVNTGNAIYDLFAPQTTPATRSITLHLPVDVIEKLQAFAYVTTGNKNAIASALLTATVNDAFAEMQDRHGYNATDQIVNDAKRYRNQDHKRRAQTEYCKACYAQNDPRDLDCRSCGAPLDAPVYEHCADCGIMVRIGFKYCADCATKNHAPETVPIPVAYDLDNTQSDTP